MTDLTVWYSVVTGLMTDGVSCVTKAKAVFVPLVL
jgi:hypothetical protein